MNTRTLEEATDSGSAAPVIPPLSPHPILDAAYGFAVTRALTAAVELDLFTWDRSRLHYGRRTVPGNRLLQGTLDAAPCADGTEFRRGEGGLARPVPAPSVGRPRIRFQPRAARSRCSSRIPYSCRLCPGITGGSQSVARNGTPPDRRRAKLLSIPGPAAPRSGRCRFRPPNSTGRRSAGPVKHRDRVY
jgi:hypothetical protein